MKTHQNHRVIVYHDETKNVPREKMHGHVILFVPVLSEIRKQDTESPCQQTSYDPRHVFLGKLQKLRCKLQCNDRKLHFADISGRKWSNEDQLILEVMRLAVGAIGRRPTRLTPGRARHLRLAVMFYPPKHDVSLYGGNKKEEKTLRYEETVLRILLKGAAHFLYSQQHRVELLEVVTDGRPAYRQFDEGRILWQLLAENESGRAPLRDYVSIASNAKIQHVASDHKKHNPGTKDHVHAHLLQVADLLLGAARHICFGNFQPRKATPRVGDKCDDKRSIIAQPLWELFEKEARRVRDTNRPFGIRSCTIARIEFHENQLVFKDELQRAIDMRRNLGHAGSKPDQL